MSPLAQAVIYSLVALPAIAQSPAFATITIKPALSANPPGARMRVLPGGNLTGSAVSVNALLSYAYDVPSNPSPRLSNLPGMGPSGEVRHRSESARQRRPARSSRRRSAKPGSANGPRAPRRPFQLVLRVENRTMPVYALTIASGGPRLQKSPIAGKAAPSKLVPMLAITSSVAWVIP